MNAPNAGASEQRRAAPNIAVRPEKRRRRKPLTFRRPIAAGAVRVAESGIHSADDVRKLRAAGFTAFLVGEHLMRSGDPAEALRALIG